MKPSWSKPRPTPTAGSAGCQTEEQGIPVRWMEGRKVAGQDRGKAAYCSASSSQITIEQYALEQYLKDGYTGFWSENTTWWTIMGLLFWDVIFAKLPGVYTPQFGDFPSRLQDIPLDFFQPTFYEKRRVLIDNRIDDLTKPQGLGIPMPSLETELTTTFHRHQGTPCRPIDWNRWNSIEELLLVVRTLSRDQLMTVLRRLLENFRDNRSGLPDLFLVKDSNPSFAEVKSELEKVADHQYEWMRFLKDQLGVPVEICRVVSK